MSVYLKSDVPLAKAQQLAAAARQRPGVAQVKVIPADRGCGISQILGLRRRFDALKPTRCPTCCTSCRGAEASSAADLDSLRRFFAAWPEVDVVQLDTEWVLRFNAILAVLRRLVLIAAALLGAGVLAVVGNTIRLEILNRRAEIEVTKLVGGSNAFVRRPFLYTGLLYGLGGAALAWVILEAAVLVLDQPVATLAQLYGSRYALQGPSGQVLAALFGGGMALGWLGRGSRRTGTCGESSRAPSPWRWIRASCPARRGSSKKAWFFARPPPPAAAGHILCLVRGPSARLT